MLVRKYELCREIPKTPMPLRRRRFVKNSAGARPGQNVRDRNETYGTYGHSRAPRIGNFATSARSGAGGCGPCLRRRRCNSQTRTGYSIIYYKYYFKQHFVRVHCTTTKKEEENNKAPSNFRLDLIKSGNRIQKEGGGETFGEKI